MNKLLLTLSPLLVAFVTAFSAQAQEAKGDAAKGASKIAMCIGCHGIAGYQASFPEVYKVPMISGQGAKFITSALNAYKKGDRKHPTMRAVADSLSDQDIADVAAYYEGHGKVAGSALPAKATEPSGKVAALLNKGGCIACHGGNFSTPIDPTYPKIAGQHADYLFVALKSYKTEGMATWGRSNPIMGGIAKQFSNAELKELAAYMHEQASDLQTIPQKHFR
jgi:cytochrome c553